MLSPNQVTHDWGRVTQGGGPITQSSVQVPKYPVVTGDDKEWIVEKIVIGTDTTDILAAPTTWINTDHPYLPIANPSPRPWYIRAGDVVGYLQKPDSFDNPSGEDLTKYVASAKSLRTVIGSTLREQDLATASAAGRRVIIDISSSSRGPWLSLAHVLSLRNYPRGSAGNFWQKRLYGARSLVIPPSSKDSGASTLATAVAAAAAPSCTIRAFTATLPALYSFQAVSASALAPLTLPRYVCPSTDTPSLPLLPRTLGLQPHFPPSSPASRPPVLVHSMFRVGLSALILIL
ncbi:hypothetical protein BJ912DRAFT_1146818 [Pholiota molesta]|nr:hypothetical protein BJ912DRAFT_1146818 [Pholiota molesta]